MNSEQRQAADDRQSRPTLYDHQSVYRLLSSAPTTELLSLKADTHV